MKTYYSNTNRTVAYGRFQFTTETGVITEVTPELEALVAEGVLRTDESVVVEEPEADPKEASVATTQPSEDLED